MQISCMRHNHRVVVQDNFSSLLPNEKQLDIPEIHETTTTLLIIYNFPFTAVFLSASKCWLTANSCPIKATQITPDPRGNRREQMELGCVRGVTGERVDRNLQREREKVKVSSAQSKRREAREERRRSHWTKTDRKRGSPSLIPEGEETYCVCREKETESGAAQQEAWRQQIHPKNSPVVMFYMLIWQFSWTDRTSVILVFSWLMF